MSQISGIPEGYGGINLQGIDVVGSYADAEAKLGMAEARRARGIEKPEALKYSLPASRQFSDPLQRAISEGQGQYIMSTLIESGINPKEAANMTERAFKGADNFNKGFEDYALKLRTDANDPKYQTIDNFNALETYDDWTSPTVMTGLHIDPQTFSQNYTYSRSAFAQLQEKYGEEHPIVKSAIPLENGNIAVPASVIKQEVTKSGRTELVPYTQSLKEASSTVKSITSGSKKDLLNQNPDTKEFFIIESTGRERSFVSKEQAQNYATTTLFSEAIYEDAARDGFIDNDERSVLMGLSGIKISPMGRGLYESKFSNVLIDLETQTVTQSKRPIRWEDRSVAEQLYFAEEMSERFVKDMISNAGYKIITSETVKGKQEEEGFNFAEERKLSPVFNTEGGKLAAPLKKISGAVSVSIDGKFDFGNRVDVDIENSLQLPEGGVKISIDDDKLQIEGNAQAEMVAYGSDGKLYLFMKFSPDLVASILSGGTSSGDNRRIQRLLTQNGAWISTENTTFISSLSSGLAKNWVDINGEKVPLNSPKNIERYLTSKKALNLNPN
jgi:hypothetical protein